jgi:hypothetical protein
VGRYTAASSWAVAGLVAKPSFSEVPSSLSPLPQAVANSRQHASALDTRPIWRKLATPAPPISLAPTPMEVVCLGGRQCGRTGHRRRRAQGPVSAMSSFDPVTGSESAGGLELEVGIGDGRRKLLWQSIDDVSRVAFQQA